MQRIRKLAVPAVAAATLIGGWFGYSAIAAAADTVTITLNGSGASSSSTTGVSISGSVVTITAAGTYSLSGTLSNGQVVVNTTDTGTVNLILNGASISNSTTAPLYVADAGTVVVTLNAGTSNSLSDASTYVYPSGVTEPDAALFSTADMTINGTGSLTVKGNAYDGIASKDTLTIDSGTLNVTAVDDAIRGKDFLKVNGGTITATSTSGDGLKSTNDSDATLGYVTIAGGTVNVTAGVDCVQGESAVNLGTGTRNLSCGDDGVTATNAVNITAGTTTVTRSYEGVEGTVINISGGTNTITASDDGINGSDGVTDEMQNAANVVVTVSGGTNVVNATGDGLDSNGALKITGGITVVNGPTANNNGALDANGTFTISGGTVLAAGSAGMPQAPVSSGSQGFLNARLGASQAANTLIHITNSSGTVLASYRSTKAFQSVIYASSQITPGQSYRVYTGGSVSGTAIGGMYTSGGSISGATLNVTVTASGSFTGTTNPTTPATTTPSSATPSSTQPTTPPASTTSAASGTKTCAAAYTVTGQWSGGFQAEVKVTAGTAAISGWKVTWTFANGQTVSQAWGATVTSSGTAVTATNVSYNGSLAAGGSTTFGFIGTSTSTNTVPAVACTAS